MLKKGFLNLSRSCLNFKTNYLQNSLHRLFSEHYFTKNVLTFLSLLMIALFILWIVFASQEVVCFEKTLPFTKLLLLTLSFERGNFIFSKKRNFDKLLKNLYSRSNCKQVTHRFQKTRKSLFAAGSLTGSQFSIRRRRET